MRTSTTNKTCFQATMTLVLGNVVALFAYGQDPLPLQHLWELQPSFGDIWSYQPTARATHIDLDSLESPQSQVRLQAARMICMNYDREGFQDAGRAVDLLLKGLSNPEEDPLVRRAMMSAICSLPSSTHAETLWGLAQSDPISQSILERALIRWKHAVAAETWRRRLQSMQAPSESLGLALEGLGALGDPKDVPLLTETLLDQRTNETNRLLAARSIGTFGTHESIDLAERILASKIEHRMLLATALLNRQSGERVFGILNTILETGPDVAKRYAASTLAEQFPAAIMARIEEWTRSTDSFYRRIALELLQRDIDTVRLNKQASFLEDTHSEIRTRARELLLQNARNEFREAVDSIVNQALQGGSPHAIEQAIHMAVALQDRNRFDLLVPLLDHPEPEAHLYSAWAIRELVDANHDLTKVIAKAETLTEDLDSGRRPLSKSEFLELSYLLEVFGKLKIEAVQPMLQKYIPKNDFKMGSVSRASAIWSLGQIRRESSDPVLRAQLQERIGDLPPDKPENYLVRYACILALGEFGYNESRATIETYGGAPPNPLGYAAQWSLKRISELQR